VAFRQQQEHILGVLHGKERHSTPTQHMVGEEKAHVEQEAPEEEDGLSKDDSEEEEEEGAPWGDASSSRPTTG
jgi:hypothetical protein